VLRKPPKLRRMLFSDHMQSSQIIVQWTFPEAGRGDYVLFSQVFAGNACCDDV
jgi:hypothetical protein